MLADLHTHTHYSNLWWRVESRLSPKQVLQIAVKRGLGIVAVTDHNTLAGSEVALALQPQFPSLIIVPGEEITSREGDILAYGIATTIPKGLSAAETVARIHQQGGVAVAAHPFQRNVILFGRNLFRRGLGEVCRVLPLEGVEYMGSSLRRVNGVRNRRARAYGKEGHLALLANSDAHFGFRVGRCQTTFPANCRTWHDVLAAIRAGDCFPAGGATWSFFRQYSLGLLNQFFGRFFLDK
ncbi:MAG: PHP-associated domain-containing protein [bacterium]|nr:PHP-associated domain-containing protein [bacterium]